MDRSSMAIHQPQPTFFADTLYTLTKVPDSLNSGKAYTVLRGNHPYTLYFVQTPLLLIDASGPIVDEPKQNCKLTWLVPGDSTVHSWGGIEIRGSSSLSFAKKSYNLELWSDTLTQSSRHLSFSGLRSDNNWILDGMYNDPLRMRNLVSHELWRDLFALPYPITDSSARPSVKATYTEVILNGTYQGVYALSERVDRKLLQLERSRDLSGGELYKGTGFGNTQFEYLPDFDNQFSYWGGFEHEYPHDTLSWEKLFAFVQFVMESKDSEFHTNIGSHFDLENARLYYLFLNLLRARDNTGKNVYIARYNPDYPYFFVPWDLDGSWGMDWLGQPDTSTTEILKNGLLSRLLLRNPQDYRLLLADRWDSLRKGPLAYENLESRFRQRYQFLLNHKLLEREQIKWNEFQPSDQDLEALLTWTQRRLHFLDAHFQQVKTGTLRD